MDAATGDDDRPALVTKYDDLTSSMLPFKQLEELRKLVMSGELRQEIYNEIHRIQVSKFAASSRKMRAAQLTSASTTVKVMRAAASSPAILTKKSFKMLTGSGRKGANVDSRLRTPDGDVFQEASREKGMLWICSLGKAAKRKSRAKVTWKKRELTLFDSRIEFAKRKRQSTLLWLNEDFYVDGSSIPNPTGEATTWIVSNYECSFAFAAESVEEKERWISSLDNVLRVLREFAEAPGDAPLFLDRPRRTESVIERDYSARLESYRESLGNEEEDDVGRDPEVAPEVAPEPPTMVEVPTPAAADAAAPRLEPPPAKKAVSVVVPVHVEKLPPASPINSAVASPRTEQMRRLSSADADADDDSEKRLALEKEAKNLEQMKSKIQEELDGWSNEVSRLKKMIETYELREEELITQETQLVELAEIALDDVERFVSRENKARAELKAKEKEVSDAKQLIEQIDDEEDESSSVVSVHEDDDELLAIGREFRKARRNSVQKQEYALSSRLQALLESDNKGRTAPAATSTTTTTSFQEVPTSDNLSSAASAPPPRNSDLSRMKDAARPSSRRLSLLRRSSSSVSQRASQRAQLLTVLESKQKEVSVSKRALREATDMRAASMGISQKRSEEADAAEAERVEVTGKLYAVKKSHVTAQAKLAKARHKHARLMEHFNILRVKLEELSSSNQSATIVKVAKTPPQSTFDDDDDVEEGDVDMDVLNDDHQIDHESSLTSMNGTPIVLSPFGEHIRAASRKKREDSMDLPQNRRKSRNPLGKFTMAKERRASELERDLQLAEFEGEMIT